MAEHIKLSMWEERRKRSLSGSCYDTVQLGPLELKLHLN